MYRGTDGRTDRQDENIYASSLLGRGIIKKVLQAKMLTLTQYQADFIGQSSLFNVF